MLRLVGFALLGMLGTAAAGCSGCGDEEGGTTTTTRPRDSGAEDSGGGDGFDANTPLPFTPDTGTPLPGEPPPELAGQPCAVDTNKLYDIVTLDRPASAVQFGVDLEESRFGATFIGDSEACTDAVYLASMQGPSGIGEPAVELVSDECAFVGHATLARVGSAWLVAVVDTRTDQYDLWVRPHGAARESAYQVTESLAQEREVALTAVDLDPEAAFEWGALIAWAESNGTTGVSTLKARPLSADGEPTGDAVVLAESDTWTYSSLSLGRLSDGLAALAYRRSDMAGNAEIVLDVLVADTAERHHDSWVLTSEAGPFGTTELGTDEEGGAVIYSLGQGASAQLWIQRLDREGRAAPVMSGILVGGPSEPQRVIAPPSNAIDASLAKLPVGYAVAYRALPGLTIDSPRIRVHFLDRTGSIIASSDVALASEFGGRTAIEAGYDGRIAIGWTDANEDGTSTLKLVKLPCVGGA